MKATFLGVWFSAFVVSAGSLSAQEPVNPTGLPGDHFSLNGALEAFKKSASPEEFEKMLNRPDNEVNNLDLNNDGKVDYIKVIGKKDKNVQLFILQVPVTEEENQDIAVIELERRGDEEAVIQIVGDQDIFGEELVVEPGTDDDGMGYFNSANGSGRGPSLSNSFAESNGIFINVWGWPGVQFVFSPFYMGWESPWSWYDYPYWWAPRQPLGWSYWYPRRMYYHRYYHVMPQPRIIYGRSIYRPMRCGSVIVYNHHRPAVSHYRSQNRSARVYNQYPDYSRGRNNAYNGRKNNGRPEPRYNRSAEAQRPSREYSNTPYGRRDERIDRRQDAQWPSNEQNRPVPEQRPTRGFDRPSGAVQRPSNQSGTPVQPQRPTRGFDRPVAPQTPDRDLNRQPRTERAGREYNRVKSAERSAPELRRAPTRQQPQREFNRNAPGRTMPAGRAGSGRPGRN